MQQFFDPQGIVVIGVSDAPANLGKNIVDNLVRWEFAVQPAAVTYGAAEDLSKLSRNHHEVPEVP